MGIEGIKLSDKINSSNLKDLFKSYLEKECAIDTENANSIFSLITDNSDEFKDFIEEQYGAVQASSVDTLLNMEIVNGQLLSEVQVEELKENENLQTIEKDEGENSVTFSLDQLGIPLEEGQTTISIPDKDGNMSEIPIDENSNVALPIAEDGSITIPTQEGEFATYNQNQDGNYDIFFDDDGKIISPETASIDLNDEGSIDAVVNQMLQNELVQEMFDLDSVNGLSKEEIKNFIQTIASCDGDSSNISIADVIVSVSALYMYAKSLEQAQIKGLDDEEGTKISPEETIQQNIDSFRNNQASKRTSSKPYGSYYSGTGETIEKNVQNKNLNLSELNEEKSTKQSELEAKKQELSSINNGEDSEVRAAQEGYEQAKGNLQDYLSTIEHYQDEQSQYSAELTQALLANMEEMDNLQTSINGKNEEISSFDSNLQDISSQKSNVNASISGYEEALSKYQNLDKDDKNYETYLAKKEEAQKNLDSAKQQLQQLEEQESTIEEQKATAQEELNEYQTKYDKLNQNQTDLENKDSLASKIAASGDKELKALKEQADSAKENIEATKDKRRKEVEAQITELNSYISEIDTQINEKTTKQTERDNSANALSLYDEEYGLDLVNSAESLWPNKGYGGYCAVGVSSSIAKTTGESRMRGDAYTYVDKMSNRDDFAEYTDFDLNSMSSSEVSEMLNSMPAGTVVVWGQNPKNKYGHVGILDGKGNEISDGTNKIWTGFKDRGSSLHVYIPTG